MTHRFDARWWVAALALAWLAVFVFSFVQFMTLEPTGSGFTRGMNRVGAWLQWQGIALLVAAGVWLVARRLDGGERGYRRLGRAPLVVSGLLLGLLCLAYLGLIIYANVNKPSPDPVTSGQSTTRPAETYSPD